VYTDDGFSLRNMQYLNKALRPRHFMQHRAHRPIHDQDRVRKPRIEVVNLHRFRFIPPGLNLPEKKEEKYITPLEKPSGRMMAEGSRRTSPSQQTRSPPATARPFPPPPDPERLDALS